MLFRASLATCGLLGILWSGGPASLAAYACGQPNPAAISAAFELAANGALHASARPSSPSGPVTVPPSLLAAIGWVESGWRQFAPGPRPLVSGNFGYGIMQVTSGMPGAYGHVDGTLPPVVANRVASDYRFNIAYGMRVLAEKRAATPRIGAGDPDVLEDWYYAIWAYNGWGWTNNPNNPRFTRQGTPATNPDMYPYQERVLYLVAHPPHDLIGNLLWPAVHVTLPRRHSIRRNPQPFIPVRIHRQPPLAIAAVYKPDPMRATLPGAVQTVHVRLVNTGTSVWPPTGNDALKLTYHLLTANTQPRAGLTALSPGVLAYGQHPLALPRTVPPGKSVVIQASVVAPSAAGRYLVAWDLQQGASTWLSALGVLSEAEPLLVQTSVGTGQSVLPTATATPLVRDMRYVADTAAPDGTTVMTDHQFTKGWLIFNAGAKPWTDGWGLHLSSGNSFGARLVAVPPTGACRSTNIVVILTAPHQPGKFHSVWRMRDPQGRTVGESLTLVLHVRRPPRATPTPTPSLPTPTPTPMG